MRHLQVREVGLIGGEGTQSRTQSRNPGCSRFSAHRLVQPGQRPRRSRYSVYLLYWYKSANTDAAVGGSGPTAAALCRRALQGTQGRGFTSMFREDGGYEKEAIYSVQGVGRGGGGASVYMVSELPRRDAGRAGEFAPRFPRGGQGEDVFPAE